MGLVDYSESESSGSESEKPQKPIAKPGAKKPFQKVVDRSNPGKIVVNLPQASADDTSQPDGPPAKRAKTGGSGLFSGFNSFLPAPKNAAAKAAPTPSSSQSKPAGISFKTSAGPGFSRDTDPSEDGESSGLGMGLPAPKRDAQPSIPDEQKPASEVKLTGKPMMFKPLSVSRNPKKKVTKPSAAPSAQPTASQDTKPTTEPEKPAPPKKVSLFSMHTEEESTKPSSSGTYEPLFESTSEAYSNVTSSYDDYAAQYARPTTHQNAGMQDESLGNIADDLNLSAAARRELFGRGGDSGLSAKKVINFNMDQEYRHNEELRASGEEQVHNPVKGIQGGGKHSLRQLVQNVQGQREALEESFAKGKGSRKEAGNRYGW